MVKNPPYNAVDAGLIPGWGMTLLLLTVLSVLRLLFPGRICQPLLPAVGRSLVHSCSSTGLHGL